MSPKARCTVAFLNPKRAKTSGGIQIEPVSLANPIPKRTQILRAAGPFDLNTPIPLIVTSQNAVESGPRLSPTRKTPHQFLPSLSSLQKTQRSNSRWHPILNCHEPTPHPRPLSLLNFKTFPKQFLKTLYKPHHRKPFKIFQTQIAISLFLILSFFD